MIYRQYRSVVLALIATILLNARTSVPAEISDSVNNTPPILITDPLIPFAPGLLKRGLWGSTAAEVMLDSIGEVVSCKVTPSENNQFDSLVIRTIAAARFTPAIEHGVKVPSTVEIEISVPYDTLIEQILSEPPLFSGTVRDTEMNIPLPHTRILLHYSDTTEDRDLTIGFNRYLSLISNVVDLRYDGIIVSTETDLNGHFAFRGLPYGNVTVSVQSKGYEIGQFNENLTRKEPHRCQYSLCALKAPLQDTVYAITVYGKQSLTEKKVNITEEEKHTGFSPFLSNVLLKKSEIRHIPETPSKMLVRSGCPYDNVYVIAGVPMLAPFHFGGHPYADIDGLMISALTDVKVTISDIAAKRVDASACIVEAEPGRIKYGEESCAKGVYMKGDLSMTGVDVMAAYSSKKNSDNFVQIGYSPSNNYMLKMKNLENFSVSLGKAYTGVPLSYGNVTLTGSVPLGSLRSTFFGWLAWDSYSEFRMTKGESLEVRNRNALKTKRSDIIPWGAASIKVSNVKTGRSYTIGGAHQVFNTGKRNFTTLISSQAFLDNGIFIVDFDTIIRKPIVAQLTTRISHERWNGFLSHKVDNTIDTLCRPEDSETAIHTNVSLSKQMGQIASGLNCLVSAIHYTDTIQFIGDVGVSVNYENDHFLAGIHFGRTTSRPDIRGLPALHLRTQINHTYTGSLPLFFRKGMITKCGIEPYARYSTRLPLIDPIDQIWDSTTSTHIRAFGADAQCRIVPIPQIELYSGINVADAQRRTYSGNPLMYEWNLPWTIRIGMHFSNRNNRLHLYADYLFTRGLPYFNQDIAAYSILPVYSSFDFKCDYRTPIKNNWLINQLDCYAVVKNIEDFAGLDNVRDYYWDSDGLQQPIFLGTFRMDIGARFGIRL